MIIRKSPAELDKMRRSGLLVYQILRTVADMVKEGVSTLELETTAERLILEAGARPAFKGYYSASAGNRYPYVLCTSVNDEIVHGMPSKHKILRKGDIISIDTGVQLEGYYGDSAITVGVGEISPQLERLLTVTKESLERAIDQVREGNRLFDICASVQKYVESNGFTIVREFVGHGIGTELHEEPQVPNYVDRNNENPRLKEGMVLAIEPILNEKSSRIKITRDGYTYVTGDKKLSVHVEHTLVVTKDGCEVLTKV